jgi:hypothetical protein
VKFFLDDDKSYWVVKNVTACPSSIRLFASFVDYYLNEAMTCLFMSIIRIRMSEKCWLSSMYACHIGNSSKYNDRHSKLAYIGILMLLDV